MRLFVCAGGLRVIFRLAASGMAGVPDVAVKFPRELFRTIGGQIRAASTKDIYVHIVDHFPELTQYFYTNQPILLIKREMNVDWYQNITPNLVSLRSL